MSLPEYQCNVCDRSFQRQTYLDDHKDSVHEQILNLVCDICDKIFTSGESLKHHKNSIHNNAVNVCEVCKKSFNRKDQLKRPTKTKGDPPRPRETLQDRGRPSKTEGDPPRPKETLQDWGRPTKTEGDPPRLRETHQDRGRPSKTEGDPPRLISLSSSNSKQDLMRCNPDQPELQYLTPKHEHMDVWVTWARTLENKVSKIFFLISLISSIWNAEMKFLPCLMSLSRSNSKPDLMKCVPD